MIKNTVSKVLNCTENDLLRAVLLALFPLALALIVSFLVISVSYYYFSYIDGTKINDIVPASKSSLFPGDSHYFQMIIIAVLAAPVYETFLFFKIPMTLVSHYNFNKTLSVHIVSFVFALTHVLVLSVGFGKLVTYFAGVVSAWSWYLYQELPEDKKMLYPYWFLVLIHSLYNIFSLLVMALVYEFI
ncbi:MAG TPA: CPBP family intramembrane metalloprotease [Rhodothermales bacterium]|nr:CPBP family intramembrane metalloprotease [Rhodothermales bacterium]